MATSRKNDCETESANGWARLRVTNGGANQVRNRKIDRAHGRTRPAPTPDDCRKGAASLPNATLAHKSSDRFCIPQNAWCPFLLKTDGRQIFELGAARVEFSEHSEHHCCIKLHKSSKCLFRATRKIANLYAGRMNFCAFSRKGPNGFDSLHPLQF